MREGGFVDVCPIKYATFILKFKRYFAFSYRKYSVGLNIAINSYLLLIHLLYDKEKTKDGAFKALFELFLLVKEAASACGLAVTVICYK